MGFLDSLCDYNAGEAGASWPSFWKIENLCALTTLGAVVPLFVAVLTCVALTALWRNSSSTTASSRDKMGYNRQLSINDSSGETFSMPGGGYEESKASFHHDNNGFAASVSVPLLDNHSNEDVVMVDSPESAAETGADCDVVDGRGTTPKKGTGVHWLKLLLYCSQVAFHLSIAGYDLVDGHADDPYKYVSCFLLALAWTVHCITECVHHAITERRRNPPYQVIFPLIAFGSALWVLLRTVGVGGVVDIEAAAWDLGLLLVIIIVEIWSCVRIVPVKHYKHLTPEYAASIWSLYNFHWYTKVINEGYTKQLNLEDLPELVDDDRARHVWARYSKLIYPRGQKAVKDGEMLNVGGNIMRLCGKRYYLQASSAVIAALMQLIPPLALNQITDYMESYDPEASEGIPFVVVCSIAGLFFAQAIVSYANSTLFKLGRRLGIRARSALVTAVFRKAMSIDMSSADAGQLQNHISVDAESVINLMVYQMVMWSAIIRLVGFVMMLFWVLGISAISGLSLIFLSLPINKVLVARLKTLQLKLMKRRDERMSVVSESMHGIRIIKLFAWESNFLAKIVDARSLEMVLLRAYMFTLGAFMVAVKASPTLIGLLTFLVHTKAFGYDLTAAAGFTALALFNQLRVPLFLLPDTINYYIQARASFNRIESFLARTTDDVRNDEVNRNTGSDRHCLDLAKGQLKIENGSFRWRQATAHSTPALSNINLDVEQKQLVCVYGSTGAGKSSLLMACLQELVTVSGRSLMNGSVAYASQRAWIQNATVRDNILFGSPYDSHRYEQVLEACALKSDLEILDAGDQTEIGEKGVNLSVGQQQRVSLARAVYADTDIVLLDDVLSAVDAHVGKHIFDKCIRKMLMDKTVVLVTHQVTMSAHYADKIVVIDSDGTIKEQGTYDELAADGEGRLVEAIEAGGGGGAKFVRQARTSSAAEDEDKDAKEPDKPSALKTIIEVEKRAVGRPKLSLFTTYFRYCGGVWFGVAWVVLSTAWQALTVAQSFTLRTWINQMGEGRDTGSGFWLYVCFSVASFVALLMRTLLITSGSLMASRRVHHEMSEGVFGAPVSWYDATPMGRIFNRFSSDIITLDKDLVKDITACTDMLLSVVGVVVVIASAIPWFTVAMIPVIALCFYYANRYVQTSRQLKRLEAVMRSPLYAHFSESINGVNTIRAFEAEGRFVAGNEERVNNLNRAYYTMWCSNSWLANRVRLTAAFVCLTVGGFLVASVSSIDGSTGGLVLTYALSFTVSAVATVNLYAQMEMSINSVERLDEYCKLPQEAPAVIDGRRPSDSWPSSGEVDIRNLTLKYASSNEPVLHQLSFYVPPRTRVGIVGRTGAGKSSLMNALFRIVEPMPGSSIVVDGQNVLQMGLQDLRSRLAIIPQDPTLFRGTIRSNVDPFHDYSDSEVWNVIRQCRLHSFVTAQDLLLEHKVSAGGSNLSVGQRQLMCMARALLRRAAVLVMDEATANVDPETDALIQETMKEGFDYCTILCIAHRLRTVAFYDRVLVLSRGRTLEYDTPLALLNNPNGEFRSMCEKTGDLEGLRRVAQESFGKSSGAQGASTGSTRTV